MCKRGNDGDEQLRIVVLSDVHGNCFSLETVLEDLKNTGFDHIICNGDMIQGGPQPHETVQLLREMKCSIVMGNSDAWLMTGVETEVHPIPEERRKKLDVVRAWSLSKLDEEDCAFINSFQPTIKFELGHGKNLFAFHGSPTSFDQFLLPSTPEEEFQETLKPYADNILTGGHMHLQYTRRLRDTQNFFFNPGSVGMAFNHGQTSEQKLLDPWAEYAILTVGKSNSQLELNRVELNLKNMAKIYQNSDRPYANEMMAQYTSKK